MRNEILDEYLELWDTVTFNRDHLLPRLVDQILATPYTKPSVDTLDSAFQRHRTLEDLQDELEKVDKEYVKQLGELKEEGVVVNDDTSSRIADFLMGIVAALNKDFTRDPHLMYVIQQLYLFSSKA